MKHAVVGLLAVLSFSAFAFHPEDGDPFTQMGVGTQVKFLKSVNIKPGTKTFSIGSTNRADCTFQFDSRPFDRVIKEGTVLTVHGGYEHPYNDTLFFTNGIFVGCMYRTYSKEKKGKFTLGEFKELTSELLEITLAAPTEF